MDKKQITVLLLVGLLIIPSTAAAVVRGSPDLAVTVPNNSVSPGEQTTLQVQIQNRGDVDVGSATNPSLESKVTTARGVTAELDTSDTPFEGNVNTVSLGSLPDGEVIPAEFQITVPDSVSEGTYEVPLEVSYVHTNQIAEQTQAQNSVERTEDFMVEITVEESARFRVLNSSTDVPVNGNGNVELQVENIGSQPASDARIRLQSSTPDIQFGQSGTATRFVGDWEAGEEKTVQFKTTASSGANTESYSLTTNVLFEDTDGIPSQSNNLSVGVTPLSEQTFELNDVQADLRVGDEGTVTGTVTNLGPETANDAVLAINSDSQSINAQETEYALGSLEPNESSSFNFDLDVSEATDPGDRQLTYTVTYQNNDGDNRESKNLNTQATIAESRDEFTITSQSTELDIGSNGVISLNVTNNADEPLTNINAKAYVDDPLSLSDDEAFISRLEPGESTEIKFQASIAGSAIDKQYPLSIDLQYEQPDGDTDLTKTYSIPVTASEDEEGNDLPVPLLVVAAIGLLAIGFFLYRRQ